MTNEQVYCDLADELQNNIISGEYEWENIAVTMPIEGYNGFGIVVWCDEEIFEKYYTVTIRENYTPDEWGNDIICESTDTEDFEELENVVNSVLNKFYNKQYITR